ncbi:MAG: HAMP domain-containing histidine kinase [Gammaproteobacteria bacterium]|jgi:signal transduction histidine kinase|nr:HAMP domain-containing histidine kinase [Gammaproteobacteria bacterium]MDH3750465.1 HAMP domain-containing histidine kinase [Gammaproteobacteria bacterium]
MNTLFAKLSLALLVIVGLMGSAFFVVERINTRAYYEELTQSLNAPIAMYVTGQRDLITGGKPDLDSLRDLAAHAMVINPTAEIYLLDINGNILGHGLPEETVLHQSVDLAPVRALIDGSARIPLQGDDPRSDSSRKVFSAAEVTTDGELEGYLYVILGGQTYEALANDIGSSYIGKVSALAAVVIVLAAAVIGLLVFGLLTRRLKNLSHEMRRVSGSGFELAPAVGDLPVAGDEIDELSRSFATMSARIKEQIEQLQENDRLRRELVSNISHDLRTPLSAMLGYLETLIIKGDSLSDDERTQYLKVARRHTVRLGTLIGDLFELSKLDAASVTPNLEAFSLQELVQDIAQEFQFDSEAKGIKLAVDLDADSAFTIGDIGLIQRVLENLVRNAIRFTPNGGEVTISTAERVESVAVAVSDTGPGIPDEDLPRIFDRFYRAVEGEEARSDSSGLGLAIVKRILDLHDSRITVTSKVNAGTKFEFELPLYERAA